MLSAKDVLKHRYQDEVNIYNYYNPYKIKENVEPFMGGIPMIFMTTPTMNVLNGSNGVCDTLASANSIFSLLQETDPYILKQLQYANGGSTSPFIKLATNRFKGITLKDFSMQTTDEHESYMGWKQILPNTIVDNFTAESSLLINFSESKNLDITKLFYSWMCYIQAVRFGIHEPTAYIRNNRILDFTSSVFFFLLDFDMRTILYFCKYTGVYPTNVPLASLIMPDITSKGPVDTGLVFTYQYKEELNPQIICDFNTISKQPDLVFAFNSDQDSEDQQNQEKVKSNYTAMDSYEPLSYTIDGEDPDSNTSNTNNKIIENDGRDFLFSKKYCAVSIKSMVESNYVSQSQTGFNSSENETKKTFILDFSETEFNSAKETSNFIDKLLNADYLAKKYENIKNSMKSEASKLMAVYSATQSIADRNQYEAYAEEKRKELGIGDDTLEAIESKINEYKEEYDREINDPNFAEKSDEEKKEITNKYQMNIDNLNAQIEDIKTRREKEVLSYQDYKQSDEYKNAIKQANYAAALQEATARGEELPDIDTWYNIKEKERQAKTDENIERATSEFVKYYGAFI